MKKFLSSIVLSASLMAFSACGEKEKQDVQAPTGMVTLDLSKYGKPFSIFIPDTTTSRLQVAEQGWGALEISVGKTFRLSIREEAGDMEAKKSDIKSDEVNRFKAYVVEEPETILWESEIVKPEFHLFSTKKLGNASFLFEDFNPTDAEPLSKEQVQKMLESVKNIKENSKVEA